MSNIILQTDSYKVGHDRLDKPGTTGKEYHLIPRGGPYDEIVVFGVQALARKLAAIRVTMADINEAEKIVAAHLGPDAFNRRKWEYIVHNFGGRLPISIHALPDGSVVTPGTPIMVVAETDEECAWLPGHLETMITRNMWHPVSVATRSLKLRRILKAYSERTSDGDQLFDFRLHDFGGRSYASDDDAMMAGMAHLAVGWLGTDTIDAVVGAAKYYDTMPAGHSVWASEHSTRGTFGGPEGEEDYVAHMLRTVPTGVVSIVGDTFDIYKFVHLLGTKFREQILARDGVVVVRPDSGDPKEVVLTILSMLWGYFGGTTNSKGYKVLDSHVRVIQGDGIREDTLPGILDAIVDAGFSLDNVVFGCGTGLMMDGMTRDLLKWAYKCNLAVVDGNEIAVYKDPVTDPGKRSIRGWFDVVREDGRFIVLPETRWDSAFETVYHNGIVPTNYSLDDVRRRVGEHLA